MKKILIILSVLFLTGCYTYVSIDTVARHYEFCASKNASMVQLIVPAIGVPTVLCSNGVYYRIE